MSAASGFSSAASPSKLYDVFISFRGEDTRRNFVCHLDAALCQKAIKTYKDDRILEKGDEVWPALVRAIDNSHLCIVVFSKHYAWSTWCLRELTHMLECKKERQVLPVFYQIDPSHIRKQMGSYKEAFDQHEKNPKLDEKTVRKWRDSLKKVANFSGFDSESHLYRDDIQLIENIIKNVWQKLESIYPQSAEPEGLVGINKNIVDIEKLVRDLRAIGLWGMGGMGKTTIAKALFKKYSNSSQYTGHCFVKDIRENSSKLTSLREQLLKELFKGDDFHIDMESDFVKSKLESKTIFIVLDDVDASDQIDYLIEGIGPSSKIIITTRNRDVLNGRVDTIHAVESLDSQESLQLFSLSAFKAEQPPIEFKELSKQIVDYAQGLPLALKLLGSHFRGKSKEKWECMLTNLKRSPYKPIDNVLKLSYDGLMEEQKKIFLDIAFFFKGEAIYNVRNFLNECGFDAKNGLEVLEDRALITISNKDEVEMHDLIQEMGWKRVHEACEEDLGRRSRLSNPKEIYEVLKNKKGTDAIEGIMLDLSQIPDLNFSDDAFKEMTKLRFLKFYDSGEISFKLYIQLFDGSRSCQVWLERFDGESKFMKEATCAQTKSSFVGMGAKEGEDCKVVYAFPHSHTLKFELMKISDRPCLRYMPPILCAKNVVRFVMNNVYSEKLWDGVQNLERLKAINLQDCDAAMLPDLSKALNLEVIYFPRCFYNVPAICFEKLVRFVMHRARVKNLWDGVQNLVSLEEIDLTGCKELIKIPDLSKASKLREVSLRECENLCKVHPSLLSLKSLCTLRLSSCKNLESLQSGNHLDNLSLLDLTYCSSLKEFSLILEKIQTLDLRDTKIETLDSSIGHCTKLQSLYLNNSRIKSLPNELSNLQSLKELDVSGCRELDTSNLCVILKGLTSLHKLYLDKSSVEFLPSCIMKLPYLRHIDISNCERLRTIQGLPPTLNHLYADNCPSLETVKTSWDMETTFLWTELMMSFENCLKMNADSIESDAHNRIMVAAACQCDNSIEYCFPATEVPKWFTYHERKSLITIELPRDSDPLGFSFSLVLSLGPSSYDLDLYTRIRIECDCYLEDRKIVTSKPFSEYFWCFEAKRKSILDHVILWYNESHREAIMEAIRDHRAKHALYNPKLSFQFLVWVIKPEYDIGCKLDTAIKKCGVWPIHAAEIEYSTQQIEECMKFQRDKNRPTTKLKPSFLAWIWAVNQSDSPIGIDVAGSEFKHLTETDTNGLHNNGSRTLNLRETAIETLDSSIGHCNNLQYLHLNNSRIKSLPNVLCNLQSLKELNVSGCRELDTGNLYIILGGLRSLCNLYLGETSVECLPACIMDLPCLEHIDISNCKRLRTIQGLPLSLNHLNADDCRSLTTVKTGASTSKIWDIGTTFLWAGFMMSFENCSRLDADSIYIIESNAHKRIMVAAACQCDESIDYCFPGNEVPKWFGCHERKSLVTMELPRDSDPLGFAFSLVLSLGFSLYDVEFSTSVRIECDCYLEDRKIVTSEPYSDYFWCAEESISDHVILWYNESHSETIMEAIRDSRAKHAFYNPKLSFQFVVWVIKDDKNQIIGCKLDSEIKECGVWPILASEIEYSAQQIEECMELQTDRDRPTTKLKPSFLTKGSTSYSSSGFGVAGSQFKHLTETDFNRLHNNGSRTLSLRDTAIETLDSSIGRCSNLQSLLLNKSRIKSLPNELSNLQSLKELNVSGCRELDTGNLHIIIEGLRSLCKLYLRETNVECLPACIENLRCLHHIDVSNCKRLRTIEGVPPSLNHLNANDCTNLTILVTGMLSDIWDLGTTFLKTGFTMSLENCSSLTLTSVSYYIEREACKRIMVAAACQCDKSIDYCFPGIRFPDWYFKYRAIKSLITIELPPYPDLLGFAFALVLSLGFSLYDGQFSTNIGIECTCYFEDRKIVTSKPFNEYFWCSAGERESISNHVILWYNETHNEAIMEAIRDYRAKHPFYYPKLSFQFIVWVTKHDKNEIDWELDTAIKECGVWPIQASDIRYSARQIEEYLEFQRDEDCPTIKLKPSFLAGGSRWYSTSRIGVLGSQFKYYTGTDFKHRRHWVPSS